MAKVMGINNANNLSAEQRQKRKQTTENVATGVGVTGYATRYAGKRGILGSMMSKTNATMHMATQEVKEATTLFGRFKQNTSFYTKKLTNLFKNYENSRFIGPIVKSPIIKKCAGGLGTIMAFFVLVTGIRKTIENSSNIVNRARHEYGYWAA